jgi:DNA polymerase-3 subunit epsilon
MRQIILDTETTGLKPAQGHRIVEIGCVELLGRALSNRNLHLYLNADRDSDPEALAVHGLTTEFLADKPRFDQIADEFLAFVQGAELIIHNASFDVRFLDAELARVGKGPLASVCTITDSLLYARTLHPGKRNSLDALCDRYGISNAHRTLHGALLDSQLLAEVWLAMTRGQEGLLMDLDEPGAGPAAHRSVVGGFDPSVLVVQPASPDELVAHAAYLTDLDKAAGAAVWRQYDSLLGHVV